MTVLLFFASNVEKTSHYQIFINTVFVAMGPFDIDNTVKIAGQKAEESIGRGRNMRKFSKPENKLAAFVWKLNRLLIFMQMVALPTVQRSIGLRANLAC
jgi:hypothetical protein